MYEPKRPNLVALGLLTLWVAILALPMFAGKWLASPWSDQYSAGYAFRAWGVVLSCSDMAVALISDS